MAPQQSTVLLVSAFLLSCAPLRQHEEMEAFSVRGRVMLDGPLSQKAKPFEVDDAMKAICQHGDHTERTWIVSFQGGVADCVVVLEPSDQKAAMQNANEAVLEKVGCEYQPRVLPVQRGTDVVFKNRNSPCNGFMIGGNLSLVPAGANWRVATPAAGVFPVLCPTRDYMKATMLVLDSPWFAKTDEEGSFSVPNLPEGVYRLRMWHQGAGWTVDRDLVVSASSPLLSEPIVLKLSPPR